MKFLQKMHCIHRYRLYSTIKINHRSIWDCGNQTGTSSACVKTLWCIVERSLNFTQDHQHPCSAFTLQCRHVLKWVNEKWVLSSTAALHTQRGRLGLLLLSQVHLHRFVLPWSQYKNLFGGTWNEATTVLKPNPSQSLQSSGITWKSQAALITKHIIFWEGDWCQCRLQCSFISSTCRGNKPQTIML